ncbi:hypothetical protein FVEG_15373 [Fusarium verticillioides 7600]|uniref:Uncharacterized protein n=1 Tax=Gibberella moniliformis (strain M3125 / FGSC 7600) TaxID=334819 RepID=W7LS48_GIBM7|nr:hypothetical protein FVEG_15373 [Fusarium verticillioides 7600]EWG41983.1 hypothetical protein FVEG_15373 [Fusarium verticillioides 7600]
MGSQEGSILLSEVTSLTRARRLYDVFEKEMELSTATSSNKSLEDPCNIWVSYVQSENKIKRKKRCLPEGPGPFVIDDKLGSLDKNGRKSSGDMNMERRGTQKRHAMGTLGGRVPNGSS